MRQKDRHRDVLAVLCETGRRGGMVWMNPPGGGDSLVASVRWGWTGKVRLCLGSLRLRWRGCHRVVRPGCGDGIGVLVDVLVTRLWLGRWSA